MSPAFFFLVLAALIVFYFSLERYQSRTDFSGFLSFMGGLWVFFGVFLIPAGILGFSYFMISVLLFAGAAASSFLLPKETERRLNNLLKAVSDAVERIPELPSAGEFVTERARRVNALRGVGERVLIVFFVVFAVSILYLAFFLSAVDPVEPDDRSGFQETDDSGPIRVLPYAYRKEYTRADSYVAIITIRSVPLSGNILSRGVDAAKPEVEEHIEERYGGDATITPDGEEDITVNGHDGIRKKYDVEWENTPGVTLHGKMRVDVWYCHQNLKLVAVAYFYPNAGNAEDYTMDLVNSIHCH